MTQAHLNWKSSLSGCIESWSGTWYYTGPLWVGNTCAKCSVQLVSSASPHFRLFALQKQAAQLSQRGRSMLHVIEYLARSLKVIRNDTLEYSVGQYSIVTVSIFWHSTSNNGVTLNAELGVIQGYWKFGYGFIFALTATVAVYLAISTQYTNETRRRAALMHNFIALFGNKSLWCVVTLQFSCPVLVHLCYWQRNINRLLISS